MTEPTLQIYVKKNDVTCCYEVPAGSTVLDLIKFTDGGGILFDNKELPNDMMLADTGICNEGFVEITEYNTQFKEKMITQKDIDKLTIIKDHKRFIRNIDFKLSEICSLKLAGYTFENCIFRQTFIHDCDLYGSNLKNNIMFGVKFSDVNLTYTDFTGSNLQFSQFLYSILRYTVFNNTDLSFVTIKGCQITNIVCSVNNTEFTYETDNNGVKQILTTRDENNERYALKDEVPI